MFTGIVSHMGEVAGVTDTGERMVVKLPRQLWDETSLGDSLAINGCCLTVADLAAGGLAGFDLGATTRQRVAPLAAGDKVHVEPALRAGDRIGGHFVTGHVDACTKLLDWRENGDGSAQASFAIPGQLDARLFPERASVAIAGVSLTIASSDRQAFAVQLVAHTMAVTLLNRQSSLLSSGRINLECDYLGRFALGLAPGTNPGQ